MFYRPQGRRIGNSHDTSMANTNPGQSEGLNHVESASSFLAAHFAPPLSSQGRSTQPLNRETFSQLRKELIQGTYGQRHLDGWITDVNKLVCIVLKAGLEPASVENQSQSDEMKEQVYDCLDIIQAAVERAPQALYESSDDEILHGTADTPLFARILHYLLQLSCRWDCERVGESIISVLSTLLRSHQRQQWQAAVPYTIPTLLKAFAMDILDCLEASKSVSKSTKLSIPISSDTLALECSRANVPGDVLDKKMNLGTFPQAVISLLRFLDPLLPQSFANSGVNQKLTVMTLESSWTQHVYQRLWAVVVNWLGDNESDTIETKDRISARVLACIQRDGGLGLSYQAMASLGVERMRSSLACLSDLLSLEILAQMPSVQSMMSEKLGIIIESARHSIPLRELVKEVFLPRVVDLQNRHSVLSKAEPYLQHRLRELLDMAVLQLSMPLKQLYVADRPKHASESVVSSERIVATNYGNEPQMRPSKRIRLSHSLTPSTDQNVLHQLIDELVKSMDFEYSGMLKDLIDRISEKFVDLSEAGQCDVLRLVGRLPCALSKTLLENRSTLPVKADFLVCCVCDNDGHMTTSVQSTANSYVDDLCAAFETILPKVPRAQSVRIAAMLTLKRLLSHSVLHGKMHLASSIYGEFCLHSLRSSIRELRLVAGHSVTAFVGGNVDPELRRTNFVVILDWLRNLSEKQDIPLQETCILVLCRLAMLATDEEMNLILFRLLEYLGHPNPFVCAFAYTELSRLAQQRSVTPASLFRPFWRTLSVTIVKNLQSRPNMAEQLCDLLGMRVDDFLRLTEVYVLPYLVLMRKRDIIQKIGSAYQNIKSPFDLCSENNNLAAILAFLMSQSASDTENMVLSLLAEIDPAFRGRSLAELVRTEPILIACDLLKGLGDSEIEKNERFHRALHLLATLVPRKSSHTITVSRRSNLVGLFIEEHVLGIVTEFTNAINDVQIRQPSVEKKRVLLAIGEMIKISKGHISSALPQICACLRSALEVQELCDHAFKAWAVLIRSLHDDEVEPLIDQSLTIVIRYWDRFGSDSQKVAYELVEYILQHHKDLVQDIFDIMPSLASIPVLAKFETELNELKAPMDDRNHFLAFTRRCQNENAIVVEQALRELLAFISVHEEYLHGSVLSEQPDPVVAQLVKALLDCCFKFSSNSDSIPKLTAQCLGRVGCLDPNRVDTIKEKKDILVLSNFDRVEETFEFVLFFLQHVLIEAFLSASNTRAQGFLAFAMQNLLRISHLDSSLTLRTRDVQEEEKLRRWLELPETVRNTLIPFLTSKYTVTTGAVHSNCEYPLFSPGVAHGEWVRNFVMDLLQNGGGNAQLVFDICKRIVKGQDISIASFLLPFAVLNRAVGGTEQALQNLRNELMCVLAHPLPDANNQEREVTLQCSQSVFDVLDYLSRWLQGKRKQLNILRAARTSHGKKESHKETQSDPLQDLYVSQIKAVEELVTCIPAEVITKRAVECRSFSRALFHWEQHIRQCKRKTAEADVRNLEPLYQSLQDIYSQINEPDGVEGISAYLHVLNIEQQVLEHRKAGRWATAQSWYELQMEKNPQDADAQWNLFTCLKESGQTDAILTRFETLAESSSTIPRLLPLVVEAAWMTGKWDKLGYYLQKCSDLNIADFNIGVGSALNVLRRGDFPAFKESIENLRCSIAKSLGSNSVISLQSCHHHILQLHALTELETIACAEVANRRDVTENLERRLNILGGYVNDKQFLLGLRRAAMELSGKFTDADISSAWLASSRLLRKSGFTGPAYQSMLHAAQLNDRSATIEHARLLWKDGHHRKAIQILEGAIASNEFVSSEPSTEANSVSVTSIRGNQQNSLAARGHLLLAKWTDRAGQTQSDVIIQRYREAIKLHTRWEKAHYYLGKHYNKILESERAKPLGKEAQIYLSGEASKLVIDNYLRSLAHGNKYVFQTLPKVLTLWLEHASAVDQPFDPKRGDNEEFQRHSMNQRKKSLDDMHSQLKKYLNRMPTALLFTILPQVVARICHPNGAVYDLLTRIVAKVVNAFPQQGLWTVLAVVKSSSKDRASRGINCLNKITEAAKKMKTESSAAEMRVMINQGQRFSEEMLKLCIAPVEDKVFQVHLGRDLGFNHKVAPCRLVVPFQSMLTPILPASHDSDYLKGFRAFPRDTTTIEAVEDDAQILNSLQKPRKISIRGSDGKIYNLLCKPKDDLRKDQRLMEFNNLINRFLKKDVESSKRRLYIKTYAVTPLNEECGLIEWVDNLRTLRELVTKLLRERGVIPNYHEIRHYLDEASSDESNLGLFTTKVLAKFPPVLHDWFVEMFPEPGAWFAARLRYTRSSAVMSMVGYVLGLGDRHGENILFEEGTGGILHVDFNCLFDKGLTFEKPELVPFRLTHNMVDAFGAYGYNGPFRRTCEITLGLLRQNEDALMTILETFLHDPTTDFIGRKRRAHAKAPDTPAGVLESVRNKLRGLLPGESVPLSVDGHVDELIIRATDKRNLAAMYIGWCAFF